MSMRSFRRIWNVLALLLVLPQLAAADTWEVRDTYTNQVIYPTGTVSVFEDIVYSATNPTLAQRVYRISNVGSFPQSIGPCSIIGDQSFVISDFPYFPPQSSNTVSPGLPTSMAVQHLAYTPGTQSATVQCLASTGVVTFQVRGRVLDPNPSIILETLKGDKVPKGSTFNFGSTPAGTPALRDFRIINMGNQALAVSLSLTRSAYSVATPPPLSIAKGSEATFSLALLSSTPGSFLGELRINNNDPNDNPYTVNLTGSVSSVLAPQLRITDNGNAGAVVMKGSTINIGSTSPNTALNRTFTVTNTGNTTLSITNPTTFLSGPGFSIFTSAPNSLGAGNSATFTVQFQAAASSLGTVSLLSNDSDDSPFAFNLQAAVTSTARIRVVDQTTGQTIVPGSTISFGNPAPNTMVTHTFRIYNDGTAPLILSNPGGFVSGNGFALSSPPSSPVPAGGSTAFFINFQASTTGPYSGSADLFHNDTAVANPLHFVLQATVQVPQSSVTLTASDPEASETSPNSGGFTLTRTGSTAIPLTVTLSRSGSAVDGTDYTSIATTQTFAAGQSTLNLAVNPIDDTAIEDVETATLTLAPGTGYTIGSPSSGTVSITNNDFTACTPSATRLCLQGGRFEATLMAIANSTSYTGQTLVLGDNSGGFWLFSQANIEVSVKVLDGSSVNGKFWTFHGAATDVAYTLTIKDRANASQVRTFSKPAGTFCGGADANSFLKSGIQHRKAALELDADVQATSLSAFTCAANATTTCLLGNRFQVRVKRGAAYQQVVPVPGQTGQTGSAFFWFFSPDNTEIFVKLLDGTPLNSKYWVFFGSMTDQAYTIEVTDSTTGILKSYASPGPLCGNADTAAF
jgi:hypothetical protein